MSARMAPTTTPASATTISPMLKALSLFISVTASYL